MSAVYTIENNYEMFSKLKVYVGSEEKTTL